MSGEARRRTGGNLYDARMVAALRRAGIDTVVRSVASASGARRAIHAVAPRVVVVDSIAFAYAAPALASDAVVIALAHMHVAGRAARAVLARAHRVIAVSAPLAASLRALGARRVVVVPPGTDGVPLLPPARSRDGSLRAVCVANWSRAKGIDVLARASCELGAVRIELVGDEGRGAFRQRVLDLLARSGATVVRRGALGARGVASAYARADLAIVPSRTEGYGIAAGEAVRRALPVVASDLGVLRAVVGPAGVFAPAGDASALARRVSEMRDPARRRELARAARHQRRRLSRWREAERSFVRVVVAELQRSRPGGVEMPPRGVTSPKRKRQYEKIKKGVKSRGGSERTAERIAAATTNKTRREKGETKSQRGRKKTSGRS